ncbi:transglutaminase TgpA family protein [Bailinhaonella thermotolerans]|uniref:Transglutaminase domain-containing protein n=1 Tax=Bailinhaonella thermotolerans TaxID=1070861 RepID=A0A3A4AZL2_9ACTN|nr:DUF3488 and transglutaminase-like domain-containing protein [Bailinhaonella thermotolerans]RJL31247.1 transglutaminase domain-containing protein [Bailinhaonella thermotolerans]
MRLPITAGVATAAVALSLYPLFDGWNWLWSALGAIVAVIAAATLTARAPVAAPFAPIAGVAGLLLYLTASFTAKHAFLVFVPTPSSLRALARIAAAGFQDIQRFAAPVPEKTGVVLIAAAGVGLIALLVDMCAVRLRRAALAGLPLLALFTVPAAVLPDAVPWPVFVFGAAGFIALLIADGRERLGQWGRPVLLHRTHRAERADSTPLGVAGKRIGFAAVGLSLAVPFLTPALEPSPLFGFGVGGSGPGGNTITIPNPIVGLRGTLTLPASATVLTYKSSDNKPRYLRMHSLDKFDGVNWTMTPADGRAEHRVADSDVPEPEGLSTQVPVTPVTTEVKVADQVPELRFLPLPYPPRRVRADGDWRADPRTLVVWSSRAEAGGMTYQVESLDVKPTAEQLRAVGRPPRDVQRRYSFTPEVSEEFRALTRRVVADAETPYEQAMALQRFFTGSGGFTYSLQVPEGHNASALEEFVMRSRTGYCEQFASAFALMARLLHIPSRVAVGYTGGSLAGGVFEVRTHDAHAWPELYFDGIGWLRFEPTPSGATGQGTASPPDHSLPVTPTGDATSSPTTPEDTASAAPATPGVPRGDNDPDARRGRDDRGDGLLGQDALQEEGLPVAAQVGLGLLAVLLVAALPIPFRLAVRQRRRLAGTVHAAWDELRDTLEDLGIAREPNESPRALARRLTEALGLDSDAADALRRLAEAEERLRYARAGIPQRVAPGDLPLVRAALLAAATRWRRARAFAAPASTLRRLRGLGTYLLDAFDRLDNIRIRPRRT